MGETYTYRVFLFDQDDNIHRLGRELWEGLIRQDEPLPKLRNSRVRVAAVQLLMDGDEPVKIDRIEGERWTLGPEGYLDDTTSRARFDRLRRAFNQPDPAAPATADGGNVVEAAALFTERNVYNQLEWRLTDREVTRIIHEIWPESAGGPLQPAKYLRGGTRKKKPLTFGAREARKRIFDGMSSITLAMYPLSQADLRSLADDLEDLLNDPYDRTQAKLAGGVIDMIEHTRAVQAAYGRNKGRWYVVAEIMRATGPQSWEYVTGEEVECSSKKEAGKVAQDLHRKLADHVDENHRLEVDIKPAIEWGPPFES